MSIGTRTVVYKKYGTFQYTLPNRWYNTVQYSSLMRKRQTHGCTHLPGMGSTIPSADDVNDPQNETNPG